MLTPFARRVISRIRSLNRSGAFGAITRFTSEPVAKLNPGNVRSCGRATALLAPFALSRSFCRDESRSALHHPLTRPLAAEILERIPTSVLSIVLHSVPIVTQNTSLRIRLSSEKPLKSTLWYKFLLTALFIFKSVFILFLLSSRHSCPAIAPAQGFWPANKSHDTLGCQFTNAPLGFSFHAQTCSV
jgi:hypothetical protein